MRKLLIILPLLLILSGCGGTGTDFTQSTVPPTPLPVSLTTSVDRAQGANLKLPSHELNIPPQSLSESTTVTLATTAQPGVQPLDSDFKAFGPQLLVDLGGVNHQGLTAHLPPPEHHGPPSSGQAKVFPVQIVDHLFVPLRGTEQADGSMVVKLVADAPRFQVGYVQWDPFAHPPHVNWGSYNGYYFDSNSGQFVQFIFQGSLISGIPNLGPKPCMMVHGLGSNISKQEFAPMAQYLLDQGVVTGVVGFEYDTLDSIQNNGGYLAQFYAEMATVNPNAQWRHMAHSMGCLVSREAIEKNTLPIASTGNITAFLCGPHLGSGVINILEGQLSTFQEFVEYIVMNDIMDFTNSDGERCQVNVDDAGFEDLAVGSSALASLNQDASAHHPQFVYNTLAGDNRGLEFDFLDDVIGQDFDDGLVDISSANDTGIGQVGQVVAPVNHIQAPTSREHSFPVVQQFFTP